MLLLDENLSPRLAARLEKHFPGVVHVLHVGLDNSPDIEIWRYAKSNLLTIVSKDKDFITFAKKYGYPPKLIWLGIGNVRIGQVEQSLLGQHTEILDFIESPSGEDYLSVV